MLLSLIGVGRYPIQSWPGGYPPISLMDTCPSAGWGTPHLDLEWGTPHQLDGVPLWTWDGVPPFPSRCGLTNKLKTVPSPILRMRREKNLSQATGNAFQIEYHRSGTMDIFSQLTVWFQQQFFLKILKLLVYTFYRCQFQQKYPSKLCFLPNGSYVLKGKIHSFQTMFFSDIWHNN